MSDKTEKAPKTQHEIMVDALGKERAKRNARRQCDAEDHAAGYLVSDALRGFEVRCAVADFAASQGRKQNGDKIAPKAPTVGASSESSGVSVTA